jgi:hypothetical protein
MHRVIRDHRTGSSPCRGAGREIPYGKPAAPFNIYMCMLLLRYATPDMHNVISNALIIFDHARLEQLELYEII